MIGLTILACLASALAGSAFTCALSADDRRLGIEVGATFTVVSFVFGYMAVVLR